MNFNESEMKTIFVPIDFSKCSIDSLNFAALVARKTSSSIHLFNCTQTPLYYFASDPLSMAPPAALLPEAYDNNLRKNSLHKLETVSGNKLYRGIKFSFSSESSSNVHFAILERALKAKADLIILGTRGAGNISSILLGSTAERVVRFSEIPVIVVPGKVDEGKLKNIVFASDFSEEAYGIFPFVKRISDVFRSTIHLLKVNTSDQFNSMHDDREKLDKFSRRFGNSLPKAIYNDFMKEEGILNYSREIKAGMIAIGTHGKRGLKRFFSEDVSAGIVRLSMIPILIVNLRKFKRKTDLHKK
jgi:nucleotide-binding universal stress UspA family protein